MGSRAPHPVQQNDVEIDYQALGGKNAQGQMELLLVAAKKEVVADYAAVAREASLTPVVVDVAAFAMQNAFEAAYGETADVVALDQRRRRRSPTSTSWPRGPRPSRVT